MSILHLHLRHFETFFWAARLGSFTAAAKRLNSTQSAVSMRIAEIESRLGVSVFERLNSRVVLTPKGEELMEYVENLRKLVREIQEHVASPEAVSGIVRIGVTEVIAQTWLPVFVEMLHRRFVNVKAKFTVALTQEVMDRLQGGSVDIVFAPGVSFETGIQARSLGTVEFAWMAGRMLKLPPGPLGPDALQAQRIIVLPRASFHHRAIESWFQAHDVPYRPSDECNSMSVVATLTASNIGISLLPPICYEAELARGDLRTIHTVPPHSPVEFFAITRPTKVDLPTGLIAELAVAVSTFKKTW